MRANYLYIFLCFSFLITSCEIINPPEKTPTYIQIDTIYVSNNIQSNGITDVWINIDGNVIGAFEIPALIPVIAENGQELQIRAGIKGNGMVENRLIYPFYTTYTVKLESIGEVTALIPSFDYDANSEIYGQDFEGGQLSHLYIESTSNSDTILLENSLQAIYGNKCGAIYLENDVYIYEGKFNPSYYLPRNGSAVFIELDYLCNNDFSFGIYSNKINSVDKIHVIYIKPIDEWNKIYIELTGILQKQPNAINFNFYIRAEKIVDLDKAEIYFDNIKLIKFNEY